MRHLKKYFIPHEENNFEPHSLRHKSTLAIFLIIIIIELGFLAQVFIVFDKTKFLASVLPGVLTALTNEDRTNNNLLPLKENELLKKAAEAKAQDMATKGYFAHTSPEGITPWYWLTQAGYRYVYAGENLAVNFFESKDVERAWMNSPTHKANIVRSDFTEIGIGVANGKYQGRDTVFVAQFFGKPLLNTVTPVTTTIKTTTPTTTTKPATTKPTVPAPVVPKPVPVLTPTPAPTPSTPTPVQVATVPIEPISTTVLGEETTSALSALSQSTETQGVDMFQKILTSPATSINYMYTVIGLFVLLALSLVVFIRSEIQHPAMVARGIALILVIGILSFVNIRVLHTETETPTDLTANVIQAFDSIK
jgi:hypothetical protein